MTVPNMITMLRLLMMPLLFAIFYWPFPHHYLMCTVVFTAIGITDFLDGYFARKLNQFSQFGAFIDPVADKIVVGMSFILITELYQNPWVTLAVVIIIGREITISALREWMAGLGRRDQVAVASLGKYKTFTQMFAIGALFIAAEHYAVWIDWVAYAFLMAAAFLTLLSMIDYLKKAWSVLMQD